MGEEQKSAGDQVDAPAAGPAPAVGIVLVNLGTPEAPTPAALRRFLKEFLSDPRVVEAPRLLWWLILNGIILNTRPKRSAALYQHIWTPEGSPLLVISRRLAQAFERELRRRLSDRAPRLQLAVQLAMRYGEPSARRALEALRAQGCTRVLVFPLFPQYSGATTGSTFDAVAGVLTRWRRVPDLRLIGDYHAHPAYIRALAASIRDHWTAHGRPDRLLMSFHGLPKRYAQAGDPYPEQCRRTARLLADALGLGADEWQQSFQSRFGREEWLEPYTDKTLASLGAAGLGRVDVISPGFAADCLETLEELNMTNRKIFLKAGGKEYHYIPALNDRPDHIGALVEIALEQLKGWLEPAEVLSPGQSRP